MTFPSHFKQTTLATCVLAALSLTAAPNANAVEPDISADYGVSYGLGDKGQLLTFPKVEFSLTNSQFGPNTLYEGVDSLSNDSNVIAITTTGDAIIWQISPWNGNHAPVPLGIGEVTKIDSSALTSTGEVYAWGWEGWNPSTFVPPVKVTDQNGVPLTNIQDISGGYRSSALTNTGEVYAFELYSWSNPPAQAANKVVDAVNMVPINGITDIDGQLTLNSAGQVYHWGINGSSSFASQVKDELGVVLSGITQIDYNQWPSSTALGSVGQVYTWGETWQAGNIVPTAAHLVKDTSNIPISNVTILRTVFTVPRWL